MPEPITLAAVGTLVLTEGVKFLYAQAGEVLKRWREHKTRAQAEVPATSGAAAAETAPLPPPTNGLSALEGQLAPLVVDFGRVEPLADSMRDLWGTLGAYAQGLEDVNPANPALVTKADALRRQLEAVLGQRITFKGEPRPASGTPVVTGEAEIRVLAGEAAGLWADSIEGGEVHGRLKADEVTQSGKAAGLRVGQIRGS